MYQGRLQTESKFIGMKPHFLSGRSRDASFRREHLVRNRLWGGEQRNTKPFPGGDRNQFKKSLLIEMLFLNHFCVAFLSGACDRGWER